MQAKSAIFENFVFGLPAENCALTKLLISFSDHGESRLISEIFITPPGRIICAFGFQTCYQEKFQLFQPIFGAMEKARSKIQNPDNCPCSNTAHCLNNRWGCIKQRHLNLPRYVIPQCGFISNDVIFLVLRHYLVKIG